MVHRRVTGRAPLVALMLAFSGAAVADPIEPGQTDQTLALIQAHYAKARGRDGDHRAIEASANSARQAIAIAESSLGLKVSATGGSFYTDRTEAQPSNLLSQENDRQFTSSQITISARKPLYRKKDQLMVDQAHARLRSALALVEASEQRLFAKVVMAWIDILVSRDRLLVAIESERRAMVVREETERRLQAGDIAADLLALDMARELVRRADVQDARVRLQVAERALIDLAGQDSLIPNHLSLAHIRLAPTDSQFDEKIIDLIEQNNPELKSFRYLEDAALLEREKAQAERYPTVEGYMSASKGENDAATYIRDERRLGVQVVIPLVTSGLIDAVLAQAEAELEKARAMTWSAETRLKTTGVNSLAQLRVAQSRLTSSHFQLKAATVHIRSVEASYLAGAVSRAALARAELEYLQSRYRHGELVLQYTQAWLGVHVATAMILSSRLLAAWPSATEFPMPNALLISTDSASAKTLSP